MVIKQQLSAPPLLTLGVLVRVECSYYCYLIMNFANVNLTRVFNLPCGLVVL